MASPRSNRKSAVLDSDFDIEGMQRNAEDAARMLRALANPQRLRFRLRKPGCILAACAKASGSPRCSAWTRLSSISSSS